MTQLFLLLGLAVLNRRTGSLKWPGYSVCLDHFPTWKCENIWDDMCLTPWPVILNKGSTKALGGKEFTKHFAVGSATISSCVGNFFFYHIDGCFWHGPWLTTWLLSFFNLFLFLFRAFGYCPVRITFPLIEAHIFLFLDHIHSVSLKAGNHIFTFLPSVIVWLFSNLSTTSASSVMPFLLSRSRPG